MGIGRAVTRNALYMYASQATQKLVRVAFVAVAARLLGAKGYGAYLLVMTMVMVVTTFANFGIRPLIVRLMSREKQRTEQLLSNVLVLRAVLALLAYGLLVAFVHVAGYDREVHVLTAIAGAGILFAVIQDSLEAVLLAHERVKLLGGLSVLAGLTATIAGIAVLWSGLGLRWLFATLVAVDALFAAATAVVTSRSVVPFRPRVEPAVAKTLLVDSLPFLLALLLGFMDNKVDVLMLSLVKGPLDSHLAIGYYGPAHAILLVAMLLPSSLNQVLIPVVSQRIYVDQEAVRDVVEKATKFVVLAVSFPVILATTLFARQIVALLFGPQFGPAAPALAILGWAYGFYALNLPSHSVLGSTKEMRHFLPLLAVSFLLNVALDFLLIPRYSYLGAATGTVVVLALGFVFRFYLLHRILDMRLSAARPYGKLFLVLLATLAVGYVVRAHLPWVAAAALIALVYVGLLHALGAVEPGEWRFAASLVERKGRSQPSRGDGARSGEPGGVGRQATEPEVSAAAAGAFAGADAPNGGRRE
jgi:O-antigen/teichoic acid export membrane protein